MQPRLNAFLVAPKVMQAMLDLETRVRTSGLEPSLIELVKTRASQLNGCAYCIQMHTTDALAQGETADRLFLLDAWREAPCFSDRERAALAWTESLTLIAETHAPDEDYERVAALFDPEEQVKLSLLVATINAWNRLAIGFRMVPEVAKRHVA